MRWFSSPDRSGSHSWWAALNDSRRPTRTVISLVLFASFHYSQVTRPPHRRLRSGSGTRGQLEDDRRVAVGRRIADQPEAELAREEVVPAPLHGAPLGGNDAVEVHGLGQHERRHQLVQ